MQVWYVLELYRSCAETRRTDLSIAVRAGPSITSYMVDLFSSAELLEIDTFFLAIATVVCHSENADDGVQ